MEQNNQKNWKNIYLTILTIVTVLSICGGIFFRIFDIGKNNIKSGDYKKTKEMTVITLDSFEDADLVLSLGSVEVQYGDTYKIEYNYPEKIKPTIDQKGNKLTVTQKVKSMNFNNAIKNTDYDVILTIPAGTKLNQVSFKLDMGEIKLNELDASDINIDADMGSVELENINCKNVSIDADMGSIELKDVVCTSLSADADMGGIDLKGIEADSIDCNADMGGIDVEGDFKNISATCSMGSVSVKTDKTDASFALSASMGNVSVNGKDFGNSYNQ